MNLSCNSSSPAEIEILFILGSPRVGSTLLFQFIANNFCCFFPTNRFNHFFSEFPQKWKQKKFSFVKHPSKEVPYQSSYGKTLEIDEPSEASAFFSYFFGGSHPSELKSKDPLPSRESEFVEFCVSLAKHVQTPLVFKNAWNCFRIKYLSQKFPRCRFIWIRRDISAAAHSDLLARRMRGSTSVWNSATTSNYKEIQKLPYWEQVVEQQFFYGKRIYSDLNDHCKGRFLEIWYEDLCEEPNLMKNKLEDFLKNYGFRSSVSSAFRFKQSKSVLDLKNSDDGKKISRYAQKSKFSSFRKQVV